ncbi:hypothetical protein PHMEG_00011745 [Phytophthora megakarya]|uniref:Uncharacterized protein n=1 Tax=Phytophthora megakarya TaxID=4795 RepID=A0A225WC76_9STRA|nr:hypothetical protein PHMEG_00011745 [Phytophthora megakarya]
MFGGAHFLYIAEPDRICLPGIIPSSTTSLSMGAPVVTVSWDVPPSFDSATERHIVDIPATETSLQRGPKVYDGCNGLEAPLLFEGLSADDLSDLERLLDRDLLDFLLQLINYAPTAQERDTEVRSTLVQRGISSILTHFSSERLAERIYNTMSYLRGLLAKIRDLHDHIMRSDTNKASDHALRLQDTNHALEREWSAMCQYWYRHVLNIERQSSATMAARTRFFRNVEEGLKRKAQTLQDEYARLRTELREAQDAQAASERRTDDNVISNWERLRDIFRHYAEETKPPTTWNPQINVTAMDNSELWTRRVAVVEVIQHDDTTFQNTINFWHQACAPRNTVPETISPAVVTRTWTQRCLTYEEALKLLRGDEPIYHLLPGYMVQLMLAQMITKSGPESGSWMVAGWRMAFAGQVEMNNGALYEWSDDETQTPSFSLKPDAEEADNAFEVRGLTEDLDDGADEKSKATSRTPDTKVIKRVKTNTGRTKGTRHPTDLAIRDFQSLSEYELLIIEVCDRDFTRNLRNQDEVL